MDFPVRDEALPEQRAIVKKAIEEDLLNDGRVLAVFYGGSSAKGTPTCIQILICGLW